MIYSTLSLSLIAPLKKKHSGIMGQILDKRGGVGQIWTLPIIWKITVQSHFKQISPIEITFDKVY